MSLLHVTDLRLVFGGLVAIDGLSFSVDEAEIVSVIGPNGAGKTSAFNCVTGFYRPTSGRITLRGRDLAGLRPSAIAGLGVARTFQNLRLFGGEQQMLTIGRALITGPRLLLLDEPSMGLAPLIVVQVMKLIAQINAEGTSVLLVEQNATAALKIAHRGYVIENGACVLDGPAAVLRKDPRVAEAYLGGMTHEKN
ncbi:MULTISPECIES: ABC transporter ATP-binding protein [unclassified Streptosporangium]|uniref:ABC transporter ATP-binding protein n=1 Tax=unclassified Streptosporangium TaxID=2632669 RepID=UPI002E291901|nr:MULTISPECIES: ATP-binding cassette domain-containing protein [unclassified Streptosporangium]